MKEAIKSRIELSFCIQMMLIIHSGKRQCDLCMLTQHIEVYSISDILLLLSLQMCVSTYLSHVIDYFQRLCVLLLLLLL